MVAVAAYINVESGIMVAALGFFTMVDAEP